MGISVKNNAGYWDPLLNGTGWFNYGGNAGGNGVGKGMGAASGTGAGAGVGAALGGAALIGGAAIAGNAINQTKPQGTIPIKDIAGNVNTSPNGQGNPINKGEEITPKAPFIVDGTNDNLGTDIVKPMDTSFDPYAWAKAIRDEEWAREDQIREETWEREDTAYSRAIEDLRNAGVNINLLGNITPAGSGSGITNQTGSMDYTMTAAEYNKKMEMLMQEIEQNFKGDENEKDRITGIIKSLIMGAMMFSK